MQIQAYEEFSQGPEDELEIQNQYSQEITGESDAIQTGARRPQGYNLLSQLEAQGNVRKKGAGETEVRSVKDKPRLSNINCSNTLMNSVSTYNA